MASPANLFGERTPLLIGVEGLGTPGITNIQETRESVPDEKDGVDDGAYLRHCVVRHGHHLSDSTGLQHTRRAKRKLIIACVICLIFLVGEFVGEDFINLLYFKCVNRFITIS